MQIPRSTPNGPPNRKLPGWSQQSVSTSPPGDPDARSSWRAVTLRHPHLGNLFHIIRGFKVAGSFGFNLPRPRPVLLWCPSGMALTSHEGGGRVLGFLQEEETPFLQCVVAGQQQAAGGDLPATHDAHAAFLSSSSLEPPIATRQLGICSVFFGHIAASKI